MKSRTSFSKGLLLKKDITRFAPLWGLYLIGGLLVMLTMVKSESDYFTAISLGESLGVFVMFNMLYAALCAQVLFGDLFKSRMSNALHAMPPRREHWFLIHMAAGLLFSLVPNAIGVLCLLPSLRGYWTMGLWWLLGMELQYLFFFGLAVFCCMCAGNKIGGTVIYGILNFAAPIAAWVVDTVYAPLLPGVVVNTESFNLFCPIAYLMSVNTVIYDGVIIAGDSAKVFHMLDRCPWGYLTVLAVIGAGLLGVSMLLYRRRKLEAAGDFIAFRALSPVFSFVYTVFVGAMFAMFGMAAGDDYLPFLFIGITVGYFTGQMLLRRTVKVFQGKTFLRFAGVAAFVAISLVAVRYDIFGIASWMPEADRVESVTVEFRRGEGEELTAPEDIEKLVGIHEMLMDMHDPDGKGDFMYVSLAYRMKNGATATREYRVPKGNSLKPLKQLMSQPNVVLQWSGGADALLERVNSMCVIGPTGRKVSVTEDLQEALLQAIYADCEAGSMAQQYDFKGIIEYEVEIEIKKDNGIYSAVKVNVYTDCDNTVQWIKAHDRELGPL